MARQLEARELAGALASAREVLRRVREAENPQAAQILLASATATWLTSRATLNPDDETLPAVCDDLFERSEGLSARGSVHAAPTAIIALGVKIQLLLGARQVDEAKQVAERLAAFYCGRPVSDKSADEASEVIRIVSNMVSMGAPVPAAELARKVVNRLTDAAIPEGALLAATAQCWVVIAALYTAEPEPGVPVPHDAEELRSLLAADDLPGLAAAGKDTRRLIAMGDDAIQAGEMITPLLRDHGPQWDRARMTLSMIKIAALDELGRQDEVRAAERAFIAEFSNSGDWRVDGVVEYYKRDPKHR
jgi:hypothetical protein